MTINFDKQKRDKLQRVVEKVVQQDRITTSERTKLSGIEDSADVTDATNIAAAIVGVAGKETPADADTIPLIDSAASSVLKEHTWAHLKAALKIVNDALYNKYVHPNHSGEVTSSADGEQTIATDAVTYAKMQNIVTNNRVLGTNTGDANVVEELDAGEIRTMIGVESGATADQTGAEIKTAYEAETNAFTDAKNTKLTGISTSADVSNDEEPAVVSCHNATGSEIAIRSVCYISGDQSGVPQITKAQASAEANCKGLLVITMAAIGNGSAGNCRVMGKVSGFSGLTPGAIQYLSDDTAGLIEETATTTSTEIVRIIGYALSATVLWFNPDISYIEVA